MLVVVCSTHVVINVCAELPTAAEAVQVFGLGELILYLGHMEKPCIMRVAYPVRHCKHGPTGSNKVLL